MKSKTVPVLFVLAAVLIAGIFFVSRKMDSKDEKSSARGARIVTPKSATASSSENETTPLYLFIPAKPSSVHLL